MSDVEMRNQFRKRVSWRWTLIVVIAWAAAGMGESAVIRGVSEKEIAGEGEESRIPLEALDYGQSRHRRREQVPEFTSGFDGARDESQVEYGGDRDRKNVFPRCKQIKGTIRRHTTAEAGESRDWPIMTTMPTTTTVMPQRFPTYVPIVGARALSNLDVFFAHLFENMVALQHSAGGGPVLGHKRTNGAQMEGQQGTQRTQRGPLLVCPEGYVLDDPNTVFFTGPVGSGGPSSFLPVMQPSETSFRKGSARNPFRTLDLLVEDELMGQSRAGVRSKARQDPSFWKWQSISLGKRGRLY